MKLFLRWTRLKAGPIAWLELVSLETKGGAWTCNTSASSWRWSSNLFCCWSCNRVQKSLVLQLCKWISNTKSVLKHWSKLNYPLSSVHPIHSINTHVWQTLSGYCTRTVCRTLFVIVFFVFFTCNTSLSLSLGAPTTTQASSSPDGSSAITPKYTHC